MTNYIDQATEQDDTITGTADGDYIKGSAGDDTIDGGGNGNTGYWWNDMDTVHYDDPLYVFNRSTGENVKAFNIVDNGDGSVTVERLDLANDGAVVSSDTLTNIERITFGQDKDYIEVFLDARTNMWMWEDDSGPRRADKIEGGILDDDLQGSDYGSRIDGGDGNDVIRGDTSTVAQASIIVAGGNHDTITMPTGGVATQLTVSLGQVMSAPLANADGVTIKTADTVDSSVVNAMVTAGSSNGDASLAQINLAALTDLAGFVAQVSTLREAGYEVTLWIDQPVDVGAGELAGALWLDVFDPNDYRAGDRLVGEAGNDYLDGGLGGNSDEHTWRNNNEARYSGRYEDFSLLKISVTDGSETTFVNGTTITDWWAEAQPDSTDTPATFADLLTSLGLGRVAVESGEFIIVHDTTGAEGIDVLKNIQFLSFSDEGVNVELEQKDIDWRGDSQPAGQYIEGTLFTDVITSGTGYDEINSGAGNDHIDAGAGGDRISKMAGNDFVDGGDSGTAGDRWQDADVVRFSGNLSRYDLKVVDETEVNTYFTTNFAGKGLTYDANNSYFLITDLSPVQNTGSTLVTNVDRLGFDDEAVWLNTSYNVWGHNVAGELDAEEIGIEAGNLILENHQWFGRDNVSYQGKQSRYVIEEINAGDTVVDSDGSVLFDLADLANGNITKADGTVQQGTAFDDVIVTETADTTTHNVRNWIDAKEGNDFILSGGGGDEIRPGKGIDFIDGGASGTSGDSWQRQDQVRLDVDSGTLNIESLVRLM
ncbi:iron-regulated protein FrpA-like [Sycon ciliatum]|uniref:iron-regulated protein FrpA-like n=1 Tax=Sycon ciliatum TaxID=27933 RepID=UPI0031F67D41